MLESAAEAYMLLQDAQGRAESKRLLFGPKKTDVMLPKGDLFKVETFSGSKQPPIAIGNCIAVRSITPPLGRYAVLPKEDLAPLSETQLLLLRAFSQPSDRFVTYTAGRLKDAEVLAVHSTVTVTLPGNPDPTPGRIYG
jgi:hypothetical protein